MKQNQIIAPLQKINFNPPTTECEGVQKLKFCDAALFLQKKKGDFSALWWRILISNSGFFCSATQLYYSRLQNGTGFAFVRERQRNRENGHQTIPRQTPEMRWKKTRKMTSGNLFCCEACQANGTGVKKTAGCFGAVAELFALWQLKSDDSFTKNNRQQLLAVASLRVKFYAVTIKTKRAPTKLNLSCNNNLKLHTHVFVWASVDHCRPRNCCVQCSASVLFSLLCETDFCRRQVNNFRVPHCEAAHTTQGTLNSLWGWCFVIDLSTCHRIFKLMFISSYKLID